MSQQHIAKFTNLCPFDSNTLETAPYNIGQKYNGPEYRYQSNWLGLIYNTIEFEQWAGI